MNVQCDGSGITVSSGRRNAEGSAIERWRMVDTDLECSTWTYEAVVLVKYDPSVSRSPKFMKINMPDIFDGALTTIASHMS